MREQSLRAQTERLSNPSQNTYYYFFFTSSTIPIINCALSDILSHACSLIFKCTGDCTCTCIYKAIHRQPTSFWNVYYNTTTKQHNAALYRHTDPGSNTLLGILIIPGCLCMHTPWHIFYKDSWGFHWKIYLNPYSEDLTRKFLQVLCSIWNLDLKRNNDLFNTSPS